VHNCISKGVEDTNRKGAHAISDLFGTSGRRMLKALCAGERNPHRRAALALGTLRRTLPALALALTGQFTAHAEGQAVGQCGDGVAGEVAGHRLLSICWRLAIVVSVRGPQCRLSGIGAPMRRKNFL
jgi:hypothetical protein